METDKGKRKETLVYMKDRKIGKDIGHMVMPNQN